MRLWPGAGPVGRGQTEEFEDAAMTLSNRVRQPAREARQRCIDEMAANVEDFRRGGRRGRVV